MVTETVKRKTRLSRKTRKTRKTRKIRLNIMKLKGGAPKRSKKEHKDHIKRIKHTLTIFKDIETFKQRGDSLERNEELLNWAKTTIYKDKIDKLKQTLPEEIRNLDIKYINAHLEASKKHMDMEHPSFFSFRKSKVSPSLIQSINNTARIETYKKVYKLGPSNTPYSESKIQRLYNILSPNPEILKGHQREFNPQDYYTTLLEKQLLLKKLAQPNSDVSHPPSDSRVLVLTPTELPHSNSHYITSLFHQVLPLTA